MIFFFFLTVEKSYSALPNQGGFCPVGTLGHIWGHFGRNVWDERTLLGPRGQWLNTRAQDSLL